ncbi:MAG: FHA domain-containing protein [Acidobacteriota bacterium]
MKGRLYCPTGELTVDQIFESEAILGRSRESTVVLSSGYLSAQHARIAWRADAECFFIEDLGSSNGTYLDGEPVAEPQPMGHLHVVTLAERYDFVFQDLARCAARHATPDDRGDEVSSAVGTVSRTAIKVLDLPLPDLLKSSGTAPSERTLLQKLALPLPSFLRPASDAPVSVDAEPPVQPPLPPRALPTAPAPPATAPAAPRATSDPSEVRAAHWSLEVTEGDDAGRHPLPEGEHVIGRTATADIRIRSPEVSRRHARLRIVDGRLFVRDLGSSNGTFIDDVRIEGESPLEPGQRLRFGAFETRIVVGGFSDLDRPLDRRSSS